MNAPKLEYFCGNIKGYENWSDQPKIRHSKKAYVYYRFFQEKSMMMLQNEKGEVPEWLYLLSFFWRILMIIWNIIQNIESVNVQNRWYSIVFSIKTEIEAHRYTNQ